MASETYTVMKDTNTPTLFRSTEQVLRIGDKKLFVLRLQV